MVIVPDGSKLEVEAMLPNRDAGFVHAGEAAELKVEAFTYTRYGLLHGTVRSVSRDALRGEVHMLPAERGKISEELVRDILGLAESGNGALKVARPQDAAMGWSSIPSMSIRSSAAGRR